MNKKIEPSTQKGNNETKDKLALLLYFKNTKHTVNSGSEMIEALYISKFWKHVDTWKNIFCTLSFFVNPSKVKKQSCITLKVGIKKWRLFFVFVCFSGHHFT